MCLVALAAIAGAGRSASAADGNLRKFTSFSVGQGAVVGDIVVMLNPKECTITKSTPWKHHDIVGLDAPTAEFTSGDPYRCQLELFFDTYEEKKSVREITDKLEKLALTDPETQRPPTLLVRWGGRLWPNHLLKAETTIVDADPNRLPLAAIVRTLWSAFAPFPLPPAGDPQRVPVVLSSKGPPPVVIPALLHAETIELLTLRKNGTVASRQIGWDDEKGLTPRVDFDLGDPHRLRMDFTLGTSEEKTDVRKLAARLDALAATDPQQGLPPLVGLGFDDLAYKGVLESFTLRFTLFLDDGTPVRAVMGTIWKEFSPAEEQLKGNPRH